MSYLETSLPGMKSWASLSLKLACALLGIELPQREKGQTSFRCVPGPTPKPKDFLAQCISLISLVFMRSGITSSALEGCFIRPEGREGSRHQAVGPVISVRVSG